MKKRTTKKLLWQLTKGIGKLDEELWDIYYKPDLDGDNKFLKEKNWVWVIVLEYKGKILFRAQLDKLNNAMIVDGKLEKFPYSINFETKEIKIW